MRHATHANDPDDLRDAYPGEGIVGCGKWGQPWGASSQLSRSQNDRDGFGGRRQAPANGGWSENHPFERGGKLLAGASQGWNTADG
jgi:hypothetical protein